MFLQRFFTNRINNRFFSFYINSLSRQSKILTSTRSTFCTAISKPEFLYNLEYYRQYLMSKPESYTYYFDTIAFEREVESITKPFKLLTDLLNNLEENISSDDLQKIIATEFSCDVNEICKKIIFIGKNINIRNDSTVRLIQKIDEELWEKKLSLDELLKILTAISISNFRNRSFFLKKRILRLLRNVHNLSPHQVVQIFFIIPKRDFSKSDEKFSVLSYINDNISLFNTNEVGIITRGMIKSNFTFSHHNIANAIIGRIMEDIENIHSVPLQNMCVAILKLARKFDFQLVLDLQEKSIPYVSNFSIPALLELSELGMNCDCINSSFWETAVQKFKENISNLPPLKILRIQKQSVVYNTDDELLKLIIKEFEKFEYDKEQNENFVYFLCNLAYCNLYPKNLFYIVFSEEFMSKKILPPKSKRVLFKLKLSWWILYTSMEIEKPEYLNYTLNTKTRKKLHGLCQALLWNHDTIYKKQLRNFTDEIENYLKNLYGENAVVRTDCLPQHCSGLVLRFNKYLEAQPIPEDFHVNKKGYVKKPLDDNNYWVFLNLITYNQYLLNEQTIFAHRPTQCRQLKALGYIPIMVPVKLYYSHVQNNTQDTFITELLQNSLKEKENVLKN